MLRISVQRLRVRHFHDTPQVHHSDPIAEVFHESQVVSNQQIGEAEIGLQILKQVHYLSLYGNIQRRDWLIENQKVRLDRQSACDPQSLSLAATELMWVAVNVLRTKPNPLQYLHCSRPPVRLP
jgi:hypothetical protein